MEFTRNRRLFFFFPHAGDRFLYYIIKKENFKIE